MCSLDVQLCEFFVQMIFLNYCIHSTINVIGHVDIICKFGNNIYDARIIIGQTQAKVANATLKINLTTNVV